MTRIEDAKTLLVLASSADTSLNSTVSKELGESLIKASFYEYASPLQRRYILDSYVLSKAKEDPQVPQVKTKKGLINWIEKQLNGKQKVLKTRGPLANSPLYSEFFDQHLSRLSLPDLFRIYYLLRSLQYKKVKLEIGQIIKEDLKISVSELGGRVILEHSITRFKKIDDEALAKSIAQRIEDGGKETNESFLDVNQLETRNNNYFHSLCFFHCHATQINDKKNAGPSNQDLTKSLNFQTPGVVITSLDQNSFTIDYYTPSFCVVDLGIYRY